MVGERSVRVVADPPTWRHALLREVSSKVWQHCPVVLVGLEDPSDDNEAIQHRRDDLSLETCNELRGALAPMAHIPIGDGDAPVISGSLHDASNDAVVISFDILLDDRVKGLHRVLWGALSVVILT